MLPEPGAHPHERGLSVIVRGLAATLPSGRFPPGLVPALREVCQASGATWLDLSLRSRLQPPSGSTPAGAVPAPPRSGGLEPSLRGLEESDALDPDLEELVTGLRASRIKVSIAAELGSRPEEEIRRLATLARACRVDMVALGPAAATGQVCVDGGTTAVCALFKRILDGVSCQVGLSFGSRSEDRPPAEALAGVDVLLAADPFGSIEQGVDPKRYLSRAAEVLDELTGKPVFIGVSSVVTIRAY